MKVDIQAPDADKIATGKANMGRPLENLSDEEFSELCQSILVVIPHRWGEGISTGLANNFPMWGRWAMRMAQIQDPQGGYIEVARGGIVHMFLEYCARAPHIKYLVMIDNDQDVGADAPVRLAAHGLPVVSGIVTGWSPHRGIFACFTAKDEKGVPRFPSHQETQNIPSKGLIEAVQAGTGLICIRKDVLETIKEMGEEPFFVPEHIRKDSVASGQVKKSEDICFCERCRKYGFSIHVDCAVHAVHWKTIPLSWPQDNIKEDIDAVEWQPSRYDYKGVI
jgi:hypothetical protein